MEPNDTDLFYKNLPAFTDFGKIADNQYYQVIPEDWLIVITDVRDSTKAIEAGRYREVNTVGAAAIAAVQNALDQFEFPFVFGGDGATLLIPSSAATRVKRALAGLKALSRERFKLELRVGILPISDLKQYQNQIRIAKFGLAGNKSVAVFQGGGLAQAEQLIKRTPLYEIPEGNMEDVNLKGLSCRWQPIPSRKGKILSLLVLAQSKDDNQIYRQILNQFDFIFQNKFEEANPVGNPELTYKSLKECFKEESRYQESVFSFVFLKKVFEILISVAMFKYGFSPRGIQPQTYSRSMGRHSDYRKFDDALRMVLDCTESQVSQIRAFLQTLYQSGLVYYGLHLANESLMTCYVQNMSEGHHIHFVDGGKGGYTMAAKQVKQQMKAENS